MLSRLTKGKEKLVVPESHVNLRYMNTPEKQQKFKEMRMAITTAQRESSSLQTTLNTPHQQSYVQLDDSMSHDMMQIVGHKDTSLIHALHHRRLHF